jgi:hypothetical protein
VTEDPAPARVHPIFRSTFVEHHRHAIVNYDDRGIGRARYDSERQLGPILFLIPGLIQTREQQEAAGSRVNPERLPLALGTGPFVKAIAGNDATAQLKSFPEGCRCSSVSAFALMHWLARLLSIAQRLTNPQRARCAFRRSNSEVMMKC